MTSHLVPNFAYPLKFCLVLAGLSDVYLCYLENAYSWRCRAQSEQTPPEKAE